MTLTKPDNLRAKGLADMWKSERKNMLAALGAPGVVHAKHLIRIEKLMMPTSRVSEF